MTTGHTGILGDISSQISQIYLSALQLLQWNNQYCIVTLRHAAMDSLILQAWEGWLNYKDSNLDLLTAWVVLNYVRDIKLNLVVLQWGSFHDLKSILGKLLSDADAFVSSIFLKRTPINSPIHESEIEWNYFLSLFTICLYEYMFLFICLFCFCFFSP